MDWQMMIMDPVQAVMDKAFIFVPKLVGVLLILIVGWAIAMVLKGAALKLFLLLRLDTLVEKTSLKEIFEKGQIEGTLSQILSKLVYWLVMLVVFVSAVNAFGLTVTAELLDKLVLYMPKVVAAIFIAILGLFFSAIMGSIVTTASANAGIKSSATFGQVTKIVVIVFSVLTALEQLQISTRIIEMAVLVLMGSIGLAISIAFGLGARDLAGRTLEGWIKKLKE